MVKHNLRAIWSQTIHFNAGCKAGQVHSKVANDSQPSHHHWDEWSLCGTQTLTHTHPQFSQADTSIRLIRHTYRMVYSSTLRQHCWRLAIFLCYCITNTAMEKRIQHMIGFTFRQKHTAEFRQGRSGDGGQSREARKKCHPAVCFSVFHCTASCWHNKHLSGVPTEASTVLVGGLNRFSYSKALEGTARGEWQASPERWLFGSFWNYNVLLSLSLEALPGKRSAPFGVGENCRRIKCRKVVKPDKVALYLHFNNPMFCSGTGPSPVFVMGCPVLCLHKPDVHLCPYDILCSLQATGENHSPAAQLPTSTKLFKKSFLKNTLLKCKGHSDSRMGC